jgi:hypothetical protein
MYYSKKSVNYCSNRYETCYNMNQFPNSHIPIYKGKFSLPWVKFDLPPFSLKTGSTSAVATSPIKTSRFLNLLFYAVEYRIHQRTN